MKSRMLSCLIACSIACIALMSPKPAAAQFDWNINVAQALPELANPANAEAATLPNLQHSIYGSVDVAYPYVIDGLDPRSTYSQDLWNCLEYTRQELECASRPTDQLMAGYARSRSHMRTTGRHVRHRATSRCSGGVCRA